MAERRTRADRIQKSGSMKEGTARRSYRPQTAGAGGETYPGTGRNGGQMYHDVYGANASSGGQNASGPARNFAHYDQATANFLSEAITKGALSARKGTAPFAATESAYGAAPGGRSTMGKVINSQGQAQRSSAAAKVPLNPDKVRQMGYKRAQQEIQQTVQEESKQ